MRPRLDNAWERRFRPFPGSGTDFSGLYVKDTGTWRSLYVGRKVFVDAGQIGPRARPLWFKFIVGRLDESIATTRPRGDPRGRGLIR
jgi:hypothetical protein